MKHEVSWKERYEISLKEEFTIIDIMKLRNCGNPRASKIRQNAVKYCIENCIDIEAHKVPSIAVFAVTGRDITYYYDKAIQESKINNLVSCEV